MPYKYLYHVSIIFIVIIITIIIKPTTAAPCYEQVSQSAILPYYYVNYNYNSYNYNVNYINIIISDRHSGSRNVVV